MLFARDAQLKEVEQEMEEAATVARNFIDCINKNLHKANLILETTLGFLPKAQQLQTRWKQTVEEKAESIKQISKLIKVRDYNINKNVQTHCVSLTISMAQRLGWSVRAAKNHLLVNRYKRAV